MLAGACLALACCVAKGQTPGPNLLDNPGFSGQSPDFQATAGPVASGWSATPGLIIGGQTYDLLYQSVPTTALDIYNLDFDLNVTTGEGPIDFGVMWNGNLVEDNTGSLSQGLMAYDSQIPAAGASSQVALYGNQNFWTSLLDLDVNYSGAAVPSPSVPDGPPGFGLEAALLIALCAAGEWRRRKTSV